MNKSFGGFDERMSQELLEERIVSVAFEKAQEKMERDRIKPEDFSDIYSAAEIAKDAAYVADKEKQAEEDSSREAVGRRFGVVFEEIVAEQIELSDWLEFSNTQKTSKFDDFHNGIDEVVEIHEGGSTNYLALAIDVTTSTMGLDKKFDRIREEIDAGILGSVKYFKSSDGTVKRALKNVPRIVVGADRETILQLARAWVEGDKQALAEHPIQIKIIEEALIQLRAGRNYAEQKGKINLVQIFDKEIKLFEKMRSSETKRKLYKKIGLAQMRQDPVFQALEHAANSMAGKSFVKEKPYISIDDKMHKRRSVY